LGWIELAQAFPLPWSAYVRLLSVKDDHAKEHWTLPDENPPVGLILCADKGHALARYALDGLPNKIMTANCKTVLPDAEVLQQELEKTRLMLEGRGMGRKSGSPQ
jgi:hypothetical protein